MGCSFSCKPSSSSTKFKNIRVVHLNGYVEEFEHPVTVGEVTSKPPKHFVCTPTQLLSAGLRPLKPDVQLEPGRIYFLLPYSAIKSDVSPMDLASIARRLTVIGKTGRSGAKSARWADIPASPQRSSTMWSSPGSSPAPIWSSPGQSPSRVELPVEEMGVASYGMPMRNSTKSRSWKPLLDTIREMSFNRRTESDLQSKRFETLKSNSLRLELHEQ